jgi:purine nucleosidase
MPVVLTAGTKAELGGTGAQNTNLTPALPISYPGNKLILQVDVRGTATVSCSTPSGWTLIQNDMHVSNGIGQWLFETDHGAAAPSVDWNAPDGVNTAALARIYCVANVKQGTPWYTLGNTTQGSASATLSLPSLTTTLPQCLGLAFNAVGDDPPLAETAGSWIEDFEEVTTLLGNDAAIQAQSTVISTPTTISGGTMSLSPASPWVSRTLAVQPLEADRGEVPYTVNASPRPQVMYDLDIDSDIDDVADLVCMLNLEHLGQLDIVAGIVTSAQIRAAPTMKAITNYYGRTTLPIGANTNSQGSFASLYNDQTQAAFPVPGFAQASDFPTALTVQRQALAAAADNSIEYFVTCTLDSIRALLESPADGISPLTGQQLVAQKMRSLWIVAGIWPQGAATTDLGGTSARAANSNFVLTNWPAAQAPILFLNMPDATTIETGENVMVAMPASNPARFAWITYFGNANAINKRSGWSQQMALTIARGPWPNAITGTNYHRILGRRGKAAVHPTAGTTTWDFDTVGNHGFLRRLSSRATFVSTINGLLLDPSVW